jgi:hypothetical protein
MPRALAFPIRLPVVCCSVAVLVACSSLPHQYAREVEPGVTLSVLTANPGRYDGKVIALGGVIVDHQREGGRVWLRVKNRPLDADYRPHRPSQLAESEAGEYCVVVDGARLPKGYTEWARVTVVGKVMSGEMSPAWPMPAGTPVLLGLYLRGWDTALGSSDRSNATDPSYGPRIPGGIHGERF